MIRFQRTVRMAGGKAVEAMKWSKEVTEHINNTIKGTTLQVFGQYFGDISVLVWQADLDSLASLEKWVQAINDDEGYRAFIAKNAGLFVEGSTYDTVFEAL